MAGWHVRWQDGMSQKTPGGPEPWAAGGGGAEVGGRAVATIAWLVTRKDGLSQAALGDQDT